MTTPRDPIEWESTLPIRPSSPAWRATVKALYGSPLTHEERALFLEFSGGREPPESGTDELLAVVGRRGGKSETIARLAVFEALHGGHEKVLAPGQVGLIVVISPLRDQSQEILNYARGLCGLKSIKRRVAAEVRDSIELTNGVRISVMTADAVAVSGPTVLCAILDEFAKFPGDGQACSDREILSSLRPALAPLKGAPRRRLLGITSAYIRDGLAFETDRDNYARSDAPVLVVRGSTQQFNHAIDTAWLEKERRRVGPRAFAREYEAVWQDALADGYFPLDVIDRSVDHDRFETGRRPGVDYVMTIDPSGGMGAGGDNFAICIAHRERPINGAPRTVIDRVELVRPPFAVGEVVEDVAATADDWGVGTVYSDQFAAGTLAEMFAREGIKVEILPWTSGNKAPAFAKVRTAMAAGEVRFPDDLKLIGEFSSVSSRLLRSGGEEISARRGHDDLVSAVVMGVIQTMELYPATTPKGERDDILFVPSRFRDPRYDAEVAGGWHERAEDIEAEDDAAGDFYEEPLTG